MIEIGSKWIEVGWLLEHVEPFEITEVLDDGESARYRGLESGKTGAFSHIRAFCMPWTPELTQEEMDAWEPFATVADGVLIGIRRNAND